MLELHRDRAYFLLQPLLDGIQHEALFFRRKLDEFEGNVKRTAENLGMQRSHLYKKLDRYELR